MTVIGELEVNAVVNTGGVTKGVRTFTREMDEARQFTTGWNTALKVVTGTVVGLGAAAVRISIAQTEVAQSITNATQKIGLSVEELTRYRYAAGLAANMTDGALDGALERMNTNIGAAARGTGKAVKAFEELNVSAKHLESINADQRVKAIADAMARLNTQDQVRLSEKIFGQGDMALMLRGGSEGLRELALESDQTGGTLSTLANEKLDDAGNAIDRMKIAVKGAAHDMGGLLAPAIEETAHFVSNFAYGFKTLPPEISMADRLLKVNNETLQRHAGIVRQVNEAWAERDKRAGLARGAQIAATLHKETLADNRELESLRNRLASTKEGNAKFGMSEVEAARFDRQSSVDRGLNDQLVAELEVREKLEATKLANAAAQERENQLNERAASIIQESLTPLEELEQKLAEISALQAAGKLSPEQALKAAQSAQQGFAGSVGSGPSQSRAPLAAISFGSSEALRAIAQSRNQDRDKTPEKQLKELEKGNDLAQKLIDKIEASGGIELATWS